MLFFANCGADFERKRFKSNISQSQNINFRNVPHWAEAGTISLLHIYIRERIIDSKSNINLPDCLIYCCEIHRCEGIIIEETNKSHPASLSTASVVGVINQDACKKNWANLPADTTGFALDGGGRAQFGSYGPQEGNSTPTISGKEQIRQTAETIAIFAAR